MVVEINYVSVMFVSNMILISLDKNMYNGSKFSVQSNFEISPLNSAKHPLKAF
jgi:hypothetical protein